MQINRLEAKGVKGVVRLHAHALPTAFLSNFGVGFLETLYKGILRSPYGLGYVCTGRSGVIGFVCGTTNTPKMYRHVLYKNGWRLFLQAVPCLLKNPHLVIDIPAYIFYPGKGGDCAELLSIAVKKKYRGKHVGTMLAEKFLSELEKKGCASVKVITERHNMGAHKFYLKLGFRYLGCFYLSSAPMRAYIRNVASPK